MAEHNRQKPRPEVQAALTELRLAYLALWEQGDQPSFLRIQRVRRTSAAFREFVAPRKAKADKRRTLYRKQHDRALVDA